MTKTDRAVAVHEAGHAFAQYHFGIPFTAVSIMPDDESNGRCSTTPEAIDQLTGIVEGVDCETDPDDHDRIIGAHIIAWYAGPAAASKYTGRPFLECLEGQSDDEWPWEIISGLFLNVSEREAYIRAMQQQALLQVAEPAHWQAIGALADALERDREIDGPTAIAIIRTALSMARDRT